MQREKGAEGKGQGKRIEYHQDLNTSLLGRSWETSVLKEKHKRRTPQNLTCKAVEAAILIGLLQGHFSFNCRHCFLSLSLLFFIRSSLIWSLSYTLTSFSSYNGYKLNSYLTCFQRGFIAQSVEHIAPVLQRSWVRIPLEPQNFFWLYL